MPDTTVVSIGHRAALAAFHERRLELKPAGTEGFVLASVSAAAA